MTNLFLPMCAVLGGVFGYLLVGVWMQERHWTWPKWYGVPLWPFAFIVVWILYWVTWKRGD